MTHAVACPVGIDHVRICGGRWQLTESGVRQAKAHYSRYKWAAIGTGLTRAAKWEK